MSPRHKRKLSERLSDAFFGYLTIVLSFVCFLLALAIITCIVRIVVGLG